VLPAEIIVLQGILIGLIIGVMQWLALQRWVRRAGWWLLVSALAWAIGPILGPTLTGGVIGAVTGFALELLTRPLRIADTAEDEETRPSVR
jgi:MFS family permease